MGPRNFPYLLLAAGLVAAVSLSRRAPTSTAPARAREDAVPRRFVLARDVPALMLRRGERLRIEPEALVRLGDVVALRSERPELVLARYHDELMHCVAGLVVREAPTFQA